MFKGHIRDRCVDVMDALAVTADVNAEVIAPR